MSIKLKIATISLFLLGVFLTGNHLVREYVVIPSVVKLDFAESKRNARRVLEAIEREIQSLAGTAMDWGSWEQLVIEVADSGPGIPEEVLPRVFDVVFTTKKNGTGLGLFSCKAVVEQHGGTIRVRNAPTTFVIDLPRDMPGVSSSKGDSYEVI